MFNQRALKANLAASDMSKTEYAAYLGITYPTLLNRIRGVSEFKRDEIQKTRELFGAEIADIIFFAKQVS